MLKIMNPSSRIFIQYQYQHHLQHRKLSNQSLLFKKFSSHLGNPQQPNLPPKTEEEDLVTKTLKNVRESANHSQNASLKEKKLPIRQRIKDGLMHYWHGSKLLAYETRISTRLLWKLLRGEKLIRREYKQLIRTSSDLLRLVPFLVILAVPFLEFALPVILKLFPNFLPSTFEDKLSAEDRVRKQLKIKLEMAKFLQDALENMAVEGKIASPQAARRFGELFQKVPIVQSFT